jgi:hypothetical protein
MPATVAFGGTDRSKTELAPTLTLSPKEIPPKDLSPSSDNPIVTEDGPESEVIVDIYLRGPQSHAFKNGRIPPDLGCPHHRS